jgi:xanthine dehydrogenase accessory factor
MENLDLAVLKTLHCWRVQGLRALLVTVVQTWGSSPRPVGSIMALCENGGVSGSVSGGCIEDDLIYHYTRACRAPKTSNEGDGVIRAGGLPMRLRYGVKAEEAHRFGLPCGGTVELVLEFDPDPLPLASLIGLLEAGELVSRITDLQSGQVSLQRQTRPCGLAQDAQRLANTFGPEYRMLIIGAGQLSECLSTMAVFSDFSVTVCDPREEYMASWSVPHARVVRDMPDDVVRAFAPDRRSCIVAVTHDPKLDDLALLEALHTPAFYVGAIGSRKNNAARRLRMAEHFDMPDTLLERLRGPIGLYIGSKTPPEIAVSIMAEILAVKNGVALPSSSQVGAAKEALCIQDAPIAASNCELA